jgi:hypothetical protein
MSLTSSDTNGRISTPSQSPARAFLNFFRYLCSWIPSQPSLSLPSPGELLRDVELDSRSTDIEKPSEAPSDSGRQMEMAECSGEKKTSGEQEEMDDEKAEFVSKPQAEVIELHEKVKGKLRDGESKCEKEKEAIDKNVKESQNKVKKLEARKISTGGLFKHFWKRFAIAASALCVCTTVAVIIGGIGAALVAVIAVASITIAAMAVHIAKKNNAIADKDIESEKKFQECQKQKMEILEEANEAFKSCGQAMKCMETIILDVDKVRQELAAQATMISDQSEKMKRMEDESDQAKRALLQSEISNKELKEKISESASLAMQLRTELQELENSQKSEATKHESTLGEIDTHNDESKKRTEQMKAYVADLEKSMTANASLIDEIRKLMCADSEGQQGILEDLERNIKNDTEKINQELLKCSNLIAKGNIDEASTSIFSVMQSVSELQASLCAIIKNVNDASKENASSISGIITQASETQEKAKIELGKLSTEMSSLAVNLAEQERLLEEQKKLLKNSK